MRKIIILIMIMMMIMMIIIKTCPTLLENALIYFSHLW